MVSQFHSGTPIMTKYIFCLWRLDDYNDYMISLNEKNRFESILNKLTELEKDVQSLKANAYEGKLSE